MPLKTTLLLVIGFSMLADFLLGETISESSWIQKAIGRGDCEANGVRSNGNVRNIHFTAINLDPIVHWEASNITLEPNCSETTIYTLEYSESSEGCCNWKSISECENILEKSCHLRAIKERTLNDKYVVRVKSHSFCHHSRWVCSNEEFALITHAVPGKPEVTMETDNQTINITLIQPENDYSYKEKIDFHYFGHLGFEVMYHKEDEQNFTRESTTECSEDVVCYIVLKNLQPSTKYILQINSYFISDSDIKWSEKLVTNFTTSPLPTTVSPPITDFFQSTNSIIVLIKQGTSTKYSLTVNPDVNVTEPKLAWLMITVILFLIALLIIFIILFIIMKIKRQLEDVSNKTPAMLSIEMKENQYFNNFEIFDNQETSSNLLEKENTTTQEEIILPINKETDFLLLGQSIQYKIEEEKADIFLKRTESRIVQPYKYSEYVDNTKSFADNQINVRSKKRSVPGLDLTYSRLTTTNDPNQNSSVLPISYIADIQLKETKI